MAEENVDLYNAIFRANSEEAIALIESSFSSGVSDGYSLLRMAVKMRRVGIVKELLDRGYPINASGPVPYSLLHLAVGKENIEIVKLLLENGADVNCKNQNGETPFLIAVEGGDSKIVDLLLKYGADVNVDFFKAIRGGNLEEVTALIGSQEKGASSGLSEGYPLLVMAVREEHVDIVKLLLDRGCPVNTRGSSGWSPLHIAVGKSNFEIVDLLLKKGADVNKREEYGQTPIFVACERGHLRTVQLLIKAGADVRAKSCGRSTALHTAVYNAYREIAVFLLENGAQVNCPDRVHPPLHDAWEPQIIDTLMEFGANVDCRDSTGDTPLYFAAECGRARAVATLLEYGADANIKCNGNQTPLDRALEKYDYDVSYEGGDPDYESFQSCADSLLEHHAKMEAVGSHVEKSPLTDTFEEKLKELRESYQEEVLLLKSEFIDGTSVSYYDIARKDVRFLAKYMDNEEVVQAAELEEYRRKFPTYASVIKGKFRRGRARNKWLKAANRVLQQLTVLPDYCTDKIMDYLCDDDLVVLIEV